MTDTGILIDEIIDRQGFSLVWQPIISLKDKQVMGYEVLTRGPKGSKLENPINLFEEAKQNGKLFQLEKAVLIKAFQLKRKYLPPHTRMFVNVTPETLTHPLFPRVFSNKYFAELGLQQREISIEITERSSITSYENLRILLTDLRRSGFSIALDDTGSGFSSLEAIARVQPQYIKVDMSLVRRIHVDPIKQAVMEMLVGLSKRLGSSLIAEGIEYRGELEILTSLGVTYGQGYLLGKPQAQPKQH